MLCPPVQLYVYGIVPPPAVTVAEPSFPPLQVTFVVAVILADNTVGSVIVTLVAEVQRFASVTVTVQVPAVKPVQVAVV